MAADTRAAQCAHRNLDLSAQEPGPSRHDNHCLGESGVLLSADPRNWLGDKGYMGNKMLTPFRKPEGGELLDWQCSRNVSRSSILRFAPSAAGGHARSLSHTKPPSVRSTRECFHCLVDGVDPRRGSCAQPRGLGKHRCRCVVVQEAAGLVLPQPGVDSVATEQLLVRALLGDLTVVEH